MTVFGLSARLAANQTSAALGTRLSRRGFLPALLLSTLALKLFFAWRYPGFLTGDDLEIVETAAKYAVGLDYVPGALRSLFHPLLLVFPFVEAGAFAGLDDPHWLTFFACLPSILFSTAGIWVLYRLALAWGWGEPASRLAGFLYAFHWLPLAYGSTSYPRPISSCLLLGALLALERRAGSTTISFVAGVLVASAFAVRWSEGVFLVPLAVLCFWRTRDGRSVASLIGGFLLGVLLLVGVLDLLTWGKPFASLLAFLRLTRDPNLGGFVPRPWFWYGSMLLQWAGPLLVLLAFASWKDRRARLPLALALAQVVLLSFSPLKEMRYLQICVPLLALAAALGWGRFRRGGAVSRSVAAIVLVLVAPLALERTIHLLRKKSQTGIEAARLLARLEPRPRVVVLEQAWAYGERLYLGNGVTIRDLPPQHPLPADRVAEAAEGASAVALYEDDTSPETKRELFRRGFRLRARFPGEGCPTVLVWGQVFSKAAVARQASI